MANRRIYIGAIMVIVFIVILATYYRNPPESETQLVRIGVLTSTVRVNASEVFLAELAIEDINKYCCNNSIPIQFECVSKCAYGRAQEAIKATDDFHDQNVSIVVGYDWGSMLDACDYQSKKYGMIIVSPYCNSPVHRDVYKHIFQLTPITFQQTKVIAKTMVELGFLETVVFMRDFQDASGYIEDEFQKYYEGLGGTIIDTVEYILSTDPTHMSIELSNLEEAVNGSYAAIFYPENLDFRVFDNLKYHPNLHNYTWFATSEVHSNTTSTLSVYPELVEIKLIHPYLDDTPDQSIEIYREINDLYLQEFGYNLTRYSGNIYDAVWLGGLTVIEIGEYNNESFINAFPIVAKDYSGVSGNCSLDQYGDRLHGDYTIYNYVLRGESVYLSEIGYYDSEKSNNTLKK